MNSYVARRIPAQGSRASKRAARGIRSGIRSVRKTLIRYPKQISALDPIKPHYWATRKFFLKAKHKIYWSTRLAVMGMIRKTRRLYWTMRRVALQIRNALMRHAMVFNARPIVPEKMPAIQKMKAMKTAVTPQTAFEKRVKKYQQFAECALSYARQNNIDMVHAHDLNAAVAAKRIQDELQVPYVYDSHELWTQRNSPNIQVCEDEKQWEKEQEGHIIRDAAFSITVCDSIADHLSRMYVAKRPIVVRNTPNRPSTPIDPSKSLRSYYRIDQNDFLAVYVGKIAANRGILDILDALPHTRSQVKVVVLGPFDPKFREAFDQRVIENNLVGRVFWHDAVPAEEIHSWISSCDVSLTTMNQSCLSYVYALPNKLFESIQAGLPLVGPHSPEIVRIFETYRCGTSYQDGNALDLAEKLNSLIDQPGLLAQFRRGSEKAAQELCWEIEKERLLAAYDQHFSVDSLPSLLPRYPLTQATGSVR